MATKSLLHSSLLDNQYYNSMLVGNTGYIASYEDVLIDTVLTSDETSVSFSNLSNYAADGYNGLQVMIMARTNRSTTTDYMRLRFNGDSGTNYAHRTFFTNASSISANAFAGQGAIDLNRATTSQMMTSRFGVIDFTIIDPFSAEKKTTVHGAGGVGGYENLNFSGMWNNTAALTSMAFTPGGGTVIKNGSRFVLIGRK